MMRFFCGDFEDVDWFNEVFELGMQVVMIRVVRLICATIFMLSLVL